MPGETSQGTRGDSLIIGSRRFGSPLTRDSPDVGIVAERVPTDALRDAKFHCCGTDQVIKLRMMDWAQYGRRPQLAGLAKTQSSGALYFVCLRHSRSAFAR